MKVQSINQLLVLFLVAVILVSCKNSSDGVGNNQSSLATGALVSDWANPSRFIYSSTSGIDGYTDLSNGFVAEGLIIQGEGVFTYVSDTNGDPLANTSIRYYIDKRSNELFVRIENWGVIAHVHVSRRAFSINRPVASGVFPLVVALPAVGAAAAEGAAAMCLRFYQACFALMKSAPNIVKNSGPREIHYVLDKGWDNFKNPDLDVHYNNYANRQVYSGSISGIDAFLAQNPIYFGFPIGLEINLTKNASDLHLDMSSQLNSSADLLVFIQSISSYWLPSDYVELKMHVVDGRDSFLTLARTTPIGKRNIMTASITATASRFVVWENYAPPFHIHNPPDLQGYLIVNGTRYSTSLFNDSYVMSTSLSSIPLAIGDEVTVVIEDKDQFSVLALDVFPADFVLRHTYQYDGSAASLTTSLGSVYVLFR